MDAHIDPLDENCVRGPTGQGPYGRSPVAENIIRKRTWLRKGPVAEKKSEGMIREDRSGSETRAETESKGNPFQMTARTEHSKRKELVRGAKSEAQIRDLLQRVRRRGRGYENNRKVQQMRKEYTKEKLGIEHRDSLGKIETFLCNLPFQPSGGRMWSP